MINQIDIGYLADRYDTIVLMFASTFLSAPVTLCVWGISKSIVSLLLFGIFYVLFAGGCSVLYCRFAPALTDHQPTQTWLYIIFESGVVIIVGGIVIGTLLVGVSGTHKYGAGNYETLILWMGLSLLVNSFGSIGWFFRGRTVGFPR